MDGSAAFFPKQDLSEIYVKSWHADGTIRPLTYKPIEMSASNRKIDSEANESVTDVFQKRFDELLGKIEQLEQMITSSMTNPMTNPLTKKSASSTKKAGDGMMNPMEIMLQRMMNSPQVQNNPLARNAMEMYKNGNSKGLQEMAENLCRENGTSIEEMKKSIMQRFSLR